MSLRLKIWKYMEYDLSVQVFFLLASLAACVEYVLSTYIEILRYFRVPIYATFLAIFLVDLIAHLMSSPFTFNNRTALDLLSILPFLSSSISGRFFGLDCLIFLRLHKFSHCCKLLRMLRKVKFRHYERDTNISHLREALVNCPEAAIRVIELIVNIIAFLCISATVIYNVGLYEANAFEVSPPAQLDWFGAMYFTVVTCTTVGYGDIHPASVAAKATVVVIIILAFIFIPAQISVLAHAILFRPKGRRYVLRDTNSFEYISICGHVDYAFVKGLLLDVFHPCHDQEGSLPLRVIFISPSQPCEDVSSLLRLPQFKHSVEFHIGSAKNPLDLNRFYIEKSKAILILRDTKDCSLRQEEDSTFLSCIAICKYLDAVCSIGSHRPRTMTMLTYTAATKAVLQALKFNVVLCFEELKCSLIGCGAALPGYLGLFFQLNQTQNTFGNMGGGQLWHHTLPQYYSTNRYCIHQISLGAWCSNLFRSLTFRQAVLQLMKKSQGTALLTAVGFRRLGTDEVSINPATNRRLDEFSFVLVIASSAAAAAAAISSDDGFYFPTASSTIPRDDTVCQLPKSNMKISQETKTDGIQCKPSLSSRTVYRLSKISNVFSDIDSSFGRLDAHELKGINLSGHIVIIAIAGTGDTIPIEFLFVSLLCILRPLRAKDAKRKIIVLSPRAGELSSLSHEVVDAVLHEVHFVSGSGNNLAHLDAIHISRSSLIVLIHPISQRVEASVNEADRMLADEQTIICALNICLTAAECPTVTELYRDLNTIFLKLQHYRVKDVSLAWLTQVDPMEDETAEPFCPQQSAGFIFSHIVMDAMFVQMAFSPCLSKYWEQLSTASNLDKLALPSNFVGRPAMEYFEEVLETTGSIVVGIYRHPSEKPASAGSQFPFAKVLCSCCNVLLLATDEVFIITPALCS